jgi:hypothetical protein
MFGISWGSEDNGKIRPTHHKPKQIKQHGEHHTLRPRSQRMFIPMRPEHLKGESTNVDIISVEPDGEDEANCELACEPRRWLCFASCAGFLKSLSEANALCLVVVCSARLLFVVGRRHGGRHCVLPTGSRSSTEQ